MVSALITIFAKIGTGPLITVVIVVFLGPWIFSLIHAWNQAKRFDTMKAMYENNVKLVECYEGLAKDQRDVITLNTAKWQETGDSVKANQYCPLLRVTKTRVEVKGE
jgi:Zn ribbon nucleic-acid-binding protein